MCNLETLCKDCQEELNYFSSDVGRQYPRVSRRHGVTLGVEQLSLPARPCLGRPQKAQRKESFYPRCSIGLTAASKEKQAAQKLLN